MSVLSSAGKLAALRELMKERNLDAYVVPSEDAHASEYLAPCDSRRAYLTSFTGSAGCAVVTQTEALCWTDGRYWLQAEKQLGNQWTLMRSGMPNVPTWSGWLKTDLPPKSSVGIDPTLLPFSDSQALATSLSSEPVHSSLTPVTDNLVDLIWSSPSSSSSASSKPARPANEIFHLADQFTGETVGQKLILLREKLGRIGSPGMVVSMLDEVAWMFNLRGSDIPYNPVFFAYALVTRDECTLFANPSSLTDSVRQYLHANGVSVLEYEQIWPTLETWGERIRAELKATAEKRALEDAETKQAREKEEKEKERKEEGKTKEKVVKTDKILVGSKTSWAVVKALGEEAVEARRSLVEEAKAKKNATEVEGFRQCHIRDGAALVRYFAWLEDVLSKGEEWTEYDAATVLEEYRKRGKWFMGLSFQTISSTGPNAAIIHYAASEQGSAVIEKEQMYLCDSGGQYLDGTTDTTRTLHFGTPSAAERRAFTRVLQGHIALDTIVFPQGTTGYVLDILARRPLWSDGLDYRHSTSHGVGSFLNVHEGPQGVGQRITYNDVPLQAGHVISNEPGYYADGKYGIRVENIDVVKMAETRENFGGKGYLEMEHVTMVPIQTKLVMPELLTQPEKEWLNSYHAEVKEKLTPLLWEYGDERALAWLDKECKEI